MIVHQAVTQYPHPAEAFIASEEDEKLGLFLRAEDESLVNHAGDAVVDGVLVRGGLGDDAAAVGETHGGQGGNGWKLVGD